MKTHFLFFLLLTSLYSNDNIYFDSKTKLVWQDMKENNTLKLTWHEAKDYCKSLEIGQYTNFKLASLEQYRTLVNPSKINPAITENIRFSKSSSYWTNSENNNDKSKAWEVYFFSGFEYYREKSNKNLFRCVSKVNSN